jgi:hypothetical protein
MNPGKSIALSRRVSGQLETVPTVKLCYYVSIVSKTKRNKNLE